MEEKELSGLREKQRQRRHEAILSAAGNLFREQGFAKATIESIAERAEVGVATVYNYFGTKERILVELFRPSLDRSYNEAAEVIACPPEEPHKGVIDVLSCYRHLQEEWDDRELLRTFASVGIGSSGLVHDLIKETDRKLRDQLRSLLSVYARDGRVASGLNIDDATEILFSLFNQFYYQFLQQDEVSFAEIFSEFKRLVPTLFEPWNSGCEATKGAEPGRPR
jgi:AcrR family transcriptional regulator